MEIPETTTTTTIDVELSTTQIPILFKWVALLLTLVVSFTALIKTIQFLLIFHNKLFQTHPASSIPLLRKLSKNNIYEDSDSDSNPDSASDSDSDDPTTSFSSSDAEKEQDFVVKGNSKDRWQFCNFSFRRRRNGSVLDLASFFTTPVVKLWDNVVVVDDDDDNNNNNSPVKKNSLSSLFSSNVVVSLERNLSGRFLKLWDSRVDPLGPRFEEDDVIQINGKGGVLVRDDVTGELTVGDVRKIGSPLADVDTWWDANAVISGS